MEQLRLYQIDMKYVRDLHNSDDRVESVSPQIGKASRVMANNAELQKIEVEGKIIGVLNFNLMIPITDKQLTPVDLKIHNNDSFTVKAWKKLCIKELKWCRQHEIIIRDKAKNLYTLCTSKDKTNIFKGKSRCLNFEKLEKICDKYNLKH